MPGSDTSPPMAIAAPLRTVFFGTPQFAVPSLQALIDGPHEVLAVVTQPDRRVGRGRKTAQPPPIKVIAEQAGFVVHQPDRLTDLRSELESLAPDVAIVVAYGKIFRRWLLELPAHGCINVHASVLPELRGPAPIRWAVIRGYDETGVSIMRLERGVDTGPVERVATTAIGPRETADQVTGRLASLGAQALAGTLDALRSGEARFDAQDHAAATHAPLLEKTHGCIDWSATAWQIDALVRGATPWPRAWSPTEDGPLKILVTDPMARGEFPKGAAGEIVGVEGGDPVVACGQGYLALRQLQLPGRRAVAGRDAISGRQIQVGSAL